MYASTSTNAVLKPRSHSGLSEVMTLKGCLLYALQLHSSSASGEPVLIGRHVRRTLPTAVASMWLPASGSGMASMGRISAGTRIGLVVLPLLAVDYPCLKHHFVGADLPDCGVESRSNPSEGLRDSWASGASEPRFVVDQSTLWLIEIRNNDNYTTLAIRKNQVQKGTSH
ncbi:uncharacterized protein BO96DRAFT_469600 [Aspergillus niger CBS 101883]|uniref:Uncharacterized protein n=2 Tax=Aspergillus niger TaxID=5061 RepID=A2Q8C4_ASPNC|nr:uncharacterized protein BO96DRAFT_469600 [Aspergillus niger CBS 101883]XP_059599594.1 hypothetical protein An01g03840 [Aspergillus niger]PYH51939.1 hypothetical protein BO96DRAFT_469600 [Aspergillus niger CBS 101883]CAK36921.1 hypothetical protein An01g03840 [Aspergillus niger]